MDKKQEFIEPDYGDEAVEDLSYTKQSFIGNDSDVDLVKAYEKELEKKIEELSYLHAKTQNIDQGKVYLLSTLIEILGNNKFSQEIEYIKSKIKKLLNELIP